MTKKELYCMLKDLDANLQTRIDEQQKVIEFLCKYDKNEVKIDWRFSNQNEIIWYAKFLCDCKLKTADLVLATNLEEYSFDIQENSKHSFVVCVHFSNEEKQVINYYKIEKKNCKFMNVTEFFEGKRKRRNKKCSN